MKTIKEIREGQGMTKAELARRAGVSTLTVSRVEEGEKTTRVTVVRLCNALGIRIEEVGGLNLVE